MRYLLPLLLCFVSATALAESGEYRVEVIVFRNLDVVVEPDLVEGLRLFSNFPDLNPPQSPAVLKENLPGTAGIGSVTSADASGDVTTLTEAVPAANFPDDFTVVDGRSEYMDDVWRRLRASKGYRPLAFSAWQQNRVDYYPPIRVHDQSLIDTRLSLPSSMLLADLTAADPLSQYRSHLYQLDGTVQLRRSRFLHLFIDLEYRPVPAAVADNMDDGTMDDTFGDLTTTQTSLSDSTQQHEVYRLKQNRQVVTGQLQYFDTPYFGVLVFVTAIR